MNIEKSTDNEQLKRISYYEDLFDQAANALKEFDKAFHQLIQTRAGIEELKAYYSGKEWKQDYKDDEEGRIPGNLKRGVLSEDGLYDLFEEYDRLMRLFADQ